MVGTESWRPVALVLVVVALSFAEWRATATAAPVLTRRVPDEGIQPQAVVDADGVVHLIYFRGDPRHGDVYYVRSHDGAVTFSTPLRVNSQSGSVIAVGNIRGAHLALGKAGRAHVAWMGSDQAEPKADGGTASPMLYSRLDDARARFEPQRNVIQAHPGLDGGGSVAADPLGNVYVTWHAPDRAAQKGEDNRRVWIAHSSDEGASFAAETAGFAQATGACGCCGMRAVADPLGRLFILYRSAGEVVNRDMYLLRSTDHAATFQGTKIDDWKIGQCVMSTAALAATDSAVWGAWETKGQVYYALFPIDGSRTIRPIAPPEPTGRRKHPAIAGNAQGKVLVAWTEGMGWQRGGSVAWQLFDRDGVPLGEGRGEAEGVPVWSLVAVVARADGGFTVLY